MGRQWGAGELGLHLKVQAGTLLGRSHPGPASSGGALGSWELGQQWVQGAPTSPRWGRGGPCPDLPRPLLPIRTNPPL